MNNYPLVLYLLAMAGVTYLIRMLPLVLIKEKIKNKFLLSFLLYIPYAVLTVMTIPAVFTSTAHIISAVFGFAAALIVAWRGKSLPVVAAVAGGAVVLGLYGLEDRAIVEDYYARLQRSHPESLDCAPLLALNEQRGGVKKPHCDALVYEVISVVEEMLREQGMLD